MFAIYTGDGKGKTTAALGQGLRAVGSGLKVYMVQFLKGGKTGELNSVKTLRILQFLDLKNQEILFGI